MARRAGFRKVLRLVLLATVLAAAGFTLYLDFRVRHEFEGRRFALPARIFARPLELHVGLRIPLADVVDELKRLGYRDVARPGESGWYVREEGRLEIALRPFVFWDGAQPPRGVSVGFEGARVSMLKDGAGQDVPLARVEPLPIGGIYPAGNEDRILVRLNDVPKHLVETEVHRNQMAVVSTEDDVMGVRPFLTLLVRSGPRVSEERDGRAEPAVGADGELGEVARGVIGDDEEASRGVDGEVAGIGAARELVVELCEHARGGIDCVGRDQARMVGAVVRLVDRVEVPAVWMDREEARVRRLGSHSQGGHRARLLVEERRVDALALRALGVGANPDATARVGGPDERRDGDAREQHDKDEDSFHDLSDLFDPLDQLDPDLAHRRLGQRHDQITGGARRQRGLLRRRHRVRGIERIVRVERTGRQRGDGDARDLRAAHRHRGLARVGGARIHDRQRHRLVAP